MKKILLSCLIFSSFSLFAQELEPAGPSLEIPELISPIVAHNRSTTCAPDTVLYNQAKSTGAQGISINNATSAHAFSQYFDCPQEITVHGAQFVAYKPDNTGGDTIECLVYLYKASADSLPYGTWLAKDTVKVDVNNWLFNFDDMRKTAVFDTPIVMNEPYVIAVYNNSATPITMYSSDYNAGDGANEHLGSARIGFNWTRSYNLNVGGSPFNADMLFYPIVTYDLDAEFNMDPNCVTGVNTITTQNWSSPVMFNRFYSMEAFNSTAGNQCTWDWDDATPDENGINPSHTYGGGIFNVRLTDTLVGWTSSCVDVDSLSTCAPPVAAFEALDTMCLTDCLILTNNSLRADTYAWTFTGGNPASYSSALPDSVCYSAGGTFDIELIVTNNAGADTMTASIYIDPCGVGLNENNQTDLSIYPNPAQSQITLSAGEQMEQANVFDMSGKLIMNAQLNGSLQTTLDIQALPVGIYAIQIKFENGTVTNKRIEIIR